MLEKMKRDWCAARSEGGATEKRREQAAAGGTSGGSHGLTVMPQEPAGSADKETGDGRRRAAPPTTDRLRIDIDRGRTGEKVDYPDPAAAPLGTDDEAAGHPVSARERRMEASARRISRRDTRRSPPAWPFIFGTVAALLVLVAFLTA